MSLLLRVRDLSDSGAWREFVECYAPRVFAWCKKQGLQDADASDVTQTVLLRLLQSLQTFEYEPDKGTFRGWLKTVANNAVVDLMRTWRERGSGDSQHLNCILNVPDLAVESLTIEIEAGYFDELLRVAQERVQLKIKRQNWEAYRLTTVEKLTATDAARKLGIPIADIYLAKSRVLKMLRAEVRKLGWDGE